MITVKKLSFVSALPAINFRCVYGEILIDKMIMGGWMNKIHIYWYCPMSFCTFIESKLNDA